MAFQVVYPGGYSEGYNPQRSSGGGYLQPGSYGQSGGGYVPPPGAFQPQNASVSPEALRWFTMVDRDRSGKINADELKSALINGKWKRGTFFR